MRKLNPYEAFCDEYTALLEKEVERRIASQIADPSDHLSDLIKQDVEAANNVLDAKVRKHSKKLLWQMILGIGAVIAISATAGNLSNSFLLGFILFGVGLLIVANISPSSTPDFEKVKTQGFDMYSHRVTIGAAEQLLEREASEREAKAAELEAHRRLTQEHYEELMRPARRSLEKWQALHPHPDPQPFGVSPTGAEAWLCEWMIHMGAEDAQLTRTVGDGGIDIEDNFFVAQVKHYSGAVGVGEIREHIGVAVIDERGRRPLFFTSGTYSAGGIEIADRADMALFRYQVETGTVEPVNAHAKVLADAGLNPIWLEHTNRM